MPKGASSKAVSAGSHGALGPVVCARVRMGGEKWKEHSDCFVFFVDFSLAQLEFDEGAFEK